MLNASNAIVNHHSVRAAATVCALLLLGAGCDLAVYPETSEYAAEEAARASVDLDAESMPATADVVDVEVTVDTVAIHRAFDDRWILLSGEEVTTTLVAEPRNGRVADVPMRMQTYDRISFGITHVRVATDEGWHEAALTVDEVELEGDFTVDTDVTVALAFDLLSGLDGDARRGFTFEPIVTADIRPAS
jgi:hypothetical protein